jgi:hypothetical protein
MKRNTVLCGFHRMPHCTRLTHTIMETVHCCDNTKTKERTFFYNMMTMGVVEVWLRALLHRHSRSYEEYETSLPITGICALVLGSFSLQPTIMLAELEYFTLKTDRQTWSLWVLIYCQRALMMAGRVWVWTPRSLAKRGSSLNWRGW